MPKPSLRLLSRNEVKLIHEKGLELLESVGVFIDNDNVLSLFKERDIDVKGKVAFIPKDFIERALTKVKREIVLYDREGKPYAILGRDSSYFNPGSAATKLLDHKKHTIRKPLMNDLISLAILVDSLEHIALQSTALVPGDVPVRLRDRVRIYPILKYSTKPIITGAFTVDGVYDMINMLKIVVDDICSKPLAIFDVCPSPPLKWSKITSQNLVDCVKAGVPIEIIPMPQMGGTSPVTIAGSLIQHHAEVLSGIAIASLVRDDPSVIYGGSPCLIDMRYGTSPIVTPETLLLSTAYIEVAKFLGLPTHTYMGLSDTLSLDYQAGFETGISALIGLLLRANVISGPGMLEFESTFSFEKLTLDNEICGMLFRYLRGIDLDEAHLAIDVFREVVHVSSFLKHRHTLRMFRKELFFPRLLERLPRSLWQRRGKLSLMDKVEEEILKRLRTHEYQVLPPDIERELDRYFLDMCRRHGTIKHSNIDRFTR